MLFPKMRTILDERYSSLSINPSFRRRPPEGAFRTHWRRMEAATSVWAIALLTLTATGVMPLRALLIFLVDRLGRCHPQPGADPCRASVGE